MRPLNELPLEKKIHGVCFDVDDTFTTHGQVIGEAFSTLERWRSSGRLAIAVTGRPAGWCDHFARMWPIDAVVGENGAFWFAFDRKARKMRRENIQSADDQRQSKEHFPAVIADIRQRFPQVKAAADQPYRVSDLAIDFAEDCGPLPLSDAEQIAQIMRGFGMTAKISSIHVNGWFGSFDKSTTTEKLLKDYFCIDGLTAKESFIYIGDSPNDSPMFEYFPLSVGVASVKRYGDLMSRPPGFISGLDSADGFIEVLSHVLAHQRG